MVIKLPQVYACHTEGVGECGDTMVTLCSLIVSAGCTVWIFTLFLYYFDPDGSPEMDAIGKRAKIAVCLCAVIVTSFYIPSMLLVIFAGVCAKTTLGFANACGWVAAAFQITQLMPQIIHTYLHKGVGSVSVVTLYIQAPGGFMTVYFFLAAGENISTWFSVLCAATMQTILLILCLTYKYRSRGDNKMWFLDTEEDEDESKFDTMTFSSAVILAPKTTASVPLLTSA